MEPIEAVVHVNLDGGFFCALAGFTLGGFGIGASNLGLARRRPPVAEEEEQGEEEADQPEAAEQAFKPSQSED